MEIDKYKNYYKILNLEFEFTDKEIKKVYRDLSKVHHPDKGGDEKLFKVITEAYKVLSNASYRELYDKTSEHGKSYDSKTELYNFDFSNESAKVEQYKNSFDKYKKKELIDILIKLKEFQEVIEYERYITCNRCDGYGMDYNDHLFVFDCDLCDGSGEYEDKTCPSCKGRKIISAKTCDNCRGEGLILKKETIRLNEEDFQDGKLLIKFKGNVSKHIKGKVGSLYIIIDGN